MDTNFFTNKLVASNRVIYTPAAFARNNLIYLQEIGSLKAVSPHVSSRSDLASYLFFLVTDGSGILIYGGQRYELRVGDCVFIDCRRPYSQGSSEELWSLKWCHFYGSNMAGIYSKYRERGGYSVFHPDNVNAYEELLDDIMRTASSDIYTRDMHIFDRLSSLMTKIMDESWHPESKAAAGLKRNILDVKDYIDTHFQEKLTLEGLAEMFYIHKSYLARCFREQMGVTVTTYINSVRVTKAKELLRFSEETVEAIGMECGIADRNYFARMFKKIEGVSPGEYRRMWRNEGGGDEKR
ncbi:MAG: AraC family transcriptional regulator [Lachnospiraceae bacterium]|nr:AraC family transcriptional regulator [Lachnospiraceae bacterium]